MLIGRRFLFLRLIQKEEGDGFFQERTVKCIDIDKYSHL